ncbi:hypothetical protein GCK72_021077 [Caenorhabditis remanei]|uniref:JmjC domain-containing protein n=1 Tax=Caenorhabditis remanei TaxID=31234 RepID=A0A6A5GIA0_CAERE|nr:hypothetical protein GCK72_021077 [Caenorhabditis remanei]KAF1754514.1 hypothetical protein GCK72_021077 [Caenorhabditis remanei]
MQDPVQKQISKFVEILRPKEGMMKLVKDKILGVNEMQCFVKSPGSRTPAHQDNQLVASVNLNMGPGECVWICVSMIYAAILEKLMNKKKNQPLPYKANGYCVNAAWNVAEMCPVQLAAVAYTHDNNVELQYGTLLPMIYDVLLEIAQQEGHPELKNLASGNGTTAKMFKEKQQSTTERREKISRRFSTIANF